MNPFNLLGPWKYLAYAAIVVALIVGATVTVHRYNEGLREQGRAEIRTADKAAAQAQEARNRELQRAAELRYTVQAQVRERFIVTTVKEIHDAAAPLAACPLPEPVRVRLDAAAQCARGDTAAACGPDNAVPVTR